MDKLKLVEELKEKANISYEEAKIALENSNWDILDAVLHLESSGKIQGPSVAIYYTNEYSGNYNKDKEYDKTIENKEEFKEKKKDKDSFDGIFESVFEAICKAIDTCNNIFIEVKRHRRTLLKLPLTVIILLLFFAFWIIIPLAIVGLFFDIKFIVCAKSINTEKVNSIFDELSKTAIDIKEKVKKGSI